MLREEIGANAALTPHNAMTANSSLHPRFAWILCYNETGSVQEVCRKFGISRKTFYKWLKRYRNSNGDGASLTDQSRRPHHSPRGTPAAHIEILQWAKAQTGFGQRRLRQYLQEHFNITISERTIWKILKRTNGASHDESASLEAGNNGKANTIEEATI